MPERPSRDDEADIVHLAGADFLALCRATLDTGATLRFRADGISMRPFLKPGDILHAEPLRDLPPSQGEVILFEGLGGNAVAHRVVARRRCGAEWKIVTAGDGQPTALEGIIDEARVLGRVPGFERQGEVHAVARLRPALRDTLRAKWRLFSLGREQRYGWLDRALSWGARNARSVALAGIGLLQAARRRPLVGPLVRMIWPSLRGKCAIDVTPFESGQRRAYYVDAIFRGRSIGQRAIHTGFLGIADPDQWWLSGAHTTPLYRRRGVSSLLLERALEIGRQEGAPEVFVAVQADNIANLSLMKRAGFTLVDDEDLCRRINDHYRAADEARAEHVVLRIALTNPAPSQGN